MRLRTFLAASAALLSHPTAAIKLDINSPDSIKAAASNVAHAMMTWYTGNQTGGIPGILPAPYYWWEAGAMFGTLMDYWYYTGDAGFNEVVTQGMLFQVGPTNDYMPPNQTKDEGNDDQVFWGFSAMTAAEFKFPNPPPDKPQWLALAQGVWNSQQMRWDTSYCAGGLRWQIFTFNNGYDYKNSPSNAGFINLGARLYAYTGNNTYAEWTNKVWDWMESVDLITGPSQPRPYTIYDGTYIGNNCSTTVKIEWTYSFGMLLNAAAVMWNVTQDPIWEQRVNGIWRATQVFFQNKVMYEAACEPRGNCDTDQLSFKAYLSRFMAASTKWMPQLYDQFQPYLAASATAAAAQCDGTIAGLYGNACGFKWIDGSQWDGTYGFGQQMSALEVIQSNLIQNSTHPVTAKAGGISHGNPSAGTAGDTPTGAPPLPAVTTADRAGAGILTAVVIVAWLGLMWWMIV